jgi:hypothetical protein
MSGFVVRELSHAAVAAMWADYEQAIGQGSLRDAYGPHWPRPMVPHERVWVFALDGARIGWGSLLYEPAERVIWHAHGIWPAHQDQGVTRAVSRWLVDWAFTSAWEAVAVCAKILETNPRYQAYFKRRQHDPAFAWRYAGTITMPWPGYDVYCLKRERWEREREPRLSDGAHAPVPGEAEKQW